MYRYCICAVYALFSYCTRNVKCFKFPKYPIFQALRVPGGGDEIRNYFRIQKVFGSSPLDRTLISSFATLPYKRYPAGTVGTVRYLLAQSKIFGLMFSILKIKKIKHKTCYLRANFCVN
jgi:hypothetical protein